MTEEENDHDSKKKSDEKKGDDDKGFFSMFSGSGSGNANGKPPDFQWDKILTVLLITGAFGYYVMSKSPS